MALTCSGVNGMASDAEHRIHELAKYEHALRTRERRLAREEVERYKRNLQALLPVVEPKPTDFEGCVE